MVVAPRVREIENEIDSNVRALKIWTALKVIQFPPLCPTHRDINQSRRFLNWLAALPK
jgi:hypothetical protein